MSVPYPVAALLQRARALPSGFERHERALRLWSLSTAIRAAWRLGGDPAGLTEASLAGFVAAARFEDAPSRDPRLRDVLWLASGSEIRATGAEVTPRQVLEALARYCPDASTHPAGAADALLDGLEAAWIAGAFLPPGSTLCFGPEDRGGPEVRWIDLSGPRPRAFEAKRESTRASSPSLHVRDARALVPLHPLLLLQPLDRGLRVLVFAGYDGAPRYADPETDAPVPAELLATGWPHLAGQLDASLRATAVARSVTPPATCASCRHRAAVPAGTRCPRDSGVMVADAVRAKYPEDSLIGRLLQGKYALIDVVGRGGFGAIYRAMQAPVGREVAVKVIRESVKVDDGGLRARFFREAAALARLRDRATVILHDFGEEPDGLLFMVQELVPGVTLKQLLQQDGALPARRAVGIACQVLDALEEAHEQGIIHRDIKPDNVMTSPGRGGADEVKVLDFGIAKIREGSGSADDFETRSGLALGTPAYMAPEMVAHGTAGPASDLYAVGVLLYVMLAGRPPFLGQTDYEVVDQHVRSPVPPIPPARAVPLAVEQVVRQAMAKLPRERPANAAAMRDALRAALPPTDARVESSATMLDVPMLPSSMIEISTASLSEGDTGSASTGELRSGFVRRESPRWVLWAGAATAIALGAVLVYAWTPQGPGSPKSSSAAVVSSAPSSSPGALASSTPASSRAAATSQKPAPAVPSPGPGSAADVRPGEAPGSAAEVRPGEALPGAADVRPGEALPGAAGQVPTRGVTAAPANGGAPLTEPAGPAPPGEATADIRAASSTSRSSTGPAPAGRRPLAGAPVATPPGPGPDGARKPTPSPAIAPPAVASESSPRSALEVRLQAALGACDCARAKQVLLKLDQLGQAPDPQRQRVLKQSYLSQCLTLGKGCQRVGEPR